MKDFEQYTIADGVSLVSAATNRFKTNEISLSFALPLSAETASRNALLIHLLANASEEYPDLTAVNQKLALLYGASLNASVQKIGENQVMSLVISSLDDRFSLEEASISRESLALLLSLAFRPHLDENGAFFEEDIAREKRLLMEKLESEENEKRIYSLRRLEEEMFRGEPFSVNRYGTAGAIKDITNADLKKAHACFLENAKVQITAVGTADAAEIIRTVRACFANVKRAYVPPQESVFVPRAEKVRTVTERLAVKQGKLVLGFRVNMKSEAEDTSAMRAFCDVFGGGPYSKLFMNVREKLSLCYYCSARYDRRKSSIIIQCGCEEENMDKAVEEIFRQLREIQNGHFEEELASSKIGLSDAICSANDDSQVLLAWYANQMTDKTVKSPAESAAENNAVTAQQVQQCASLLSLDTIYRLAGTGEAEE